MRVLVSLAALGIILVLVHVASDVVTPFLVGAVLAVAFQPLAAALGRRGFPPAVAATLTTLLVLAVVAFGGFLVYLAASNLASDLPRYAERAEELRGSLVTWLDGRGMHDSARLVRELDLEGVAADLGTRLVLRVGDFVSAFFFVLIATAFIQLEATGYRQKLAGVLGGRRHTRWLDGALNEVQRYLIVKLAMSVANGVFLGTWCAMWGIESPLLWGLLAFALNFIPFIGSVLAAIPPILLGLVGGGIGTAAGVATGYVLVNLVVDNIVEPRLLGRVMGLSPLVLLLAMLLWGLVLGPVGAVLSVPLTMTVKLFLERDEELRKIALLMSSPRASAVPTAT